MFLRGMHLNVVLLDFFLQLKVVLFKCSHSKLKSVLLNWIFSVLTRIEF